MQLSSYAEISIIGKITCQFANKNTYVDTTRVSTRLKIALLILRLEDLILFLFGTNDSSLGFSSHYNPIYLFILLAFFNFFYLFFNVFLIC